MKKKTYHSMTRVIFQDQSTVQELLENIVHIKRKNIKTLAGINELKSLTSTFNYEKPSKRPEPLRYENAVDQFEQAINKSNQFSLNRDITWILL